MTAPVRRPVPPSAYASLAAALAAKPVLGAVADHDAELVATDMRHCIADVTATANRARPAVLSIRMVRGGVVQWTHQEVHGSSARVLARLEGGER